MVVAPDCRESHLGVGGAHWDAERRGRSLPVCGRVRVADHKAFALQDDRLRVILSSHNLSDHSPAEHQYDRVHHGSLWQLWLRRFEKRDTVSCTTQVSESLHWSPPPQTRLTLWNILIGSRDVPYPRETSTTTKKESLLGLNLLLQKTQISPNVVSASHFQVDFI